MGRIANVILVAAFGASLPAATQAATRCVNPSSKNCFKTIQQAVDAAGPGDTIKVHERKDGRAYSENVVISKSGLTIVGEGRARLGTLGEFIEFRGLEKTLPMIDGVDDDDRDRDRDRDRHRDDDHDRDRDRDVRRLLDRYPRADDLRDALATLKDMFKKEQFLARCPQVIVEVCETAAIPGRCGRNSGPTSEDRAVFVISAPNVTIENVTIRHGNDGVLLNSGSDGATIRNVCFRQNNQAIDTARPVDNVLVANSRFEGVGSESPSVDMEGNNAKITHNVFLNTEGIGVRGNDFEISFNAATVTTDHDCVRVQGGSLNGIISFNLLPACDGSVELAGNGTTVLGNLLASIPDDDGGIVGFGTGAYRILYNIVRLSSEPGIRLSSSSNLVEGNIVERNGNDTSEAGISVVGSNNRILYNLVRSNSYAGIQNDGGNANLYQGNVVTRNNTSGIRIRFGDGNTVDDNLIERNDGEGIAVNSAATNTVITDNVAKGNRTDICVDNGSTTGAGNTFGRGGFTIACVVEQ